MADIADTTAPSTETTAASAPDSLVASTISPLVPSDVSLSTGGALWFPELTAHLAPIMILSRPSDAQHEWLHLHDLRFDLEAYVVDAATLGYASARDCELAGSARVASFHDVMNGFRRASNERYH